jgi:hypothetical protein
VHFVYQPEAGSDATQKTTAIDKEPLFVKRYQKLDYK